jgi:nicotinamidase-related amidase
MPATGTQESAVSDQNPKDRRTTIIPGVSRRGDVAIDLTRCALVVVDIQKYLCPCGGGDEQSDDDDDKKKSLKYYSEHYQDQFPKVLSNIVELIKAFRSVRDGRDASVDQDGTSHPTAAAASCAACEVIFTYLQSQTVDRRDISLDYKLSGPLLANIPTACEDDDALFLPNCRPIVGSSSSSKGDLRLPKTSCDVFVSTNLDYLLRQLDIKHVVFVGQFTEQCVESAVRHAADLGYWGVVAGDACVCGSSQTQNDSLQRMRGYARVVDTETLLREIREHANQETLAR